MARQMHLVLVQSDECNPHHTTTPPHHHTTPPLEQPQGCDPGGDAVVQRLFDAWRALHRHGRQVQPLLTQSRRAAVHMAMAWGYGEEALALALEGCAASAFCQYGNRTGHALDELVWIFGTAERIERLANEGAALRRAFEQRERERLQPVAPAAATAASDAARARLRAFAAEMSRRRAGP